MKQHRYLSMFFFAILMFTSTVFAEEFPCPSTNLGQHTSGEKINQWQLTMPSSKHAHSYSSSNFLSLINHSNRTFTLQCFPDKHNTNIFWSRTENFNDCIAHQSRQVFVCH